MTLATTSSLWRSTGGDSTRTAIAGSMGMYAPFYIANAAASGNVTNISGGQAVILPANAIVSSVTVNKAGSGSVDLGFTPLSGVGPGQTTVLGTNVPQGFLANATVSSRVIVSVAGTGSGASLGNVANATNLTVVTYAANTAASGSVSGYIHYFVSDSGAQNV